MTSLSKKSFFRPLAAAAFAVGALTVAVLSLLPQELMPNVDVGDKIQHLTAYLCLALVGGTAFPGRRQQLAVGLGLFAFGIGIEFIQAFVPGRFASVGDVVANTIGVVLGLSIARFAGSRVTLAVASRFLRPK